MATFRLKQTKPGGGSKTTTVVAEKPKPKVTTTPAVPGVPSAPVTDRTFIKSTDEEAAARAQVMANTTVAGSSAPVIPNRRLSKVEREEFERQQQLNKINLANTTIDPTATTQAEIQAAADFKRAAYNQKAPNPNAIDINYGKPAVTYAARPRGSTILNAYGQPKKSNTTTFKVVKRKS